MRKLIHFPRRARRLDNFLRDFRMLVRLVLAIFLSVLFHAAAKADDPAGSPQFLAGPKFEFSPHVPLSGTLKFEADRPCTAIVELVRGDQRELVPTSTSPLKQHEVPVLGLRAGREHELHVRLKSGAADAAATPVVFTADPWPQDLPTIRLTRADPSKMEPGVTLFSLFRWDDDQGSRTFGALIVVDAAGDVVWYYRVDSPAAAVRLLENGNFLFIHGAEPKQIREIDRLGNIIREFQATALGGPVREGAIPVDVDTFHHDLFPLEDGRLLALTTEVRLLDRFPLNMLRPTRSFGSANVVGDIVIELTPQGEIVNRWQMHDLLDPQRITYGSHDSFWDSRAYGHIPGGTKDWSHANAIVRDPTDGGIIVSLRHQDAVVKIDATTAEVKWILGTHAGWRPPLARKVLKPTRRMIWPFHQHGVKLTPHGTLLLFDNGNLRAIPPSRKLPSTAAYSRAVEYEIDEEAMTVTEVWAYGGLRSDDRFYSPFLGDADWLPNTGNVLITDGARVRDASGNQVDDPPGDSQWARLVEVTHDDPAQIVWELAIDDRKTRPSLGWSVYRAERLPSLYPPREIPK